MKKTLQLLSVMVIAAMLFVGCATAPTGQNAAAEHALVQSAASTGTALALTPPTGKPEYALYFIGAKQALGTLATGTNQVSITTVEAALNAAGVTNPIVALSIENAITIGDDLIVSSAGTNNAAQIQAAQQVAGDVAAGIGQGLQLAGIQTVKHKK